MVFTLDFAKNTIVWCFFLFFFIIDVYFLISAVTGEIFNFTTELAVFLGIPTNEAKVEIGKQPFT